MKKNILLALIAIACVSCATTEKSNDNNCQIFGKHASLDYSGFKVEAHYIDKANIHWKTDKNEGHEHISYKKVAPHLHFLNWIEKDGITVSQVINCQDNTVSAFLSQKDKKSKRGERAGILMEGVIKFHQQ